jgi:hypothetical protein
MSKDKVAVAFEIVDHGIDNSQYFAGCGTMFTDYTDVGTGTGDTPAEALDDALEMLAQGGWNLDIVTEKLPDEPSASDEYPGEDSEMYYYVSVRVREYDPKHDDPVMLLAGVAIGRLADLAIEIHNTVVELEPMEADPVSAGGYIVPVQVRLRRLTEERDYLEGFLKENEVEINQENGLRRGLKAG